MTKIKTLANAIIFILLGLMLFTMLTWLLRSNDYLGRAAIVGFENEKDIDAVFIGPSTIMDYYEPLAAWGEYGFTSYNYSGVGIRGNLAVEYLEDIRRTHEPKVYVVELTTFERADSEVNESGLRNWADSLPVWSFIRAKGLGYYLKTHGVSGTDVVPYYIDLIRYHANTENLASYINWEYLNRKNIRGNYKGFEPLLDHMSAAEPAVSEDRFPRSDLRVEDIERILDYCEKENINVIFTISPRDNVVWGVDNTMGDIITERGFVFMDLNRYYDDMGLDFDTDIANKGHVNYLGAQKYTRFMAEYLQNNYDLPDHRNEEGYDEWRNLYEDYKGAQYVWRQNVMDNMAKDELQ